MVLTQQDPPVNPGSAGVAAWLVREHGFSQVSDDWVHRGHVRVRLGTDGRKIHIFYCSTVTAWSARCEDAPRPVLLAILRAAGAL